MGFYGNLEAEKNLVEYLLLVDLDQHFQEGDGEIIEAVASTCIGICENYWIDLNRYFSPKITGDFSRKQAMPLALANHCIISALARLKELVTSGDEVSVYELEYKVGFSGYRALHSIGYFEDHKVISEYAIAEEDHLPEKQTYSKIKYLRKDPYWNCILQEICSSEDTRKKEYLINRDHSDLYARIFRFGTKWRPALQLEKLLGKETWDNIYQLSHKYSDFVCDILRPRPLLTSLKDQKLIWDDPVDKLLSDYKAEQLFHFSFFQKAMKLFQKVKNRDLFLGGEFNQIIADVCLLPNAFSRTRILKIIIDAVNCTDNPEYYELEPTALGRKNIRSPKSEFELVELWKKQARRCIFTLGYLTIPLLEKTFFILLYKHFQRTLQEQSKLPDEKKVLSAMMESLYQYAENHLDLLRHDFYEDKLYNSDIEAVSEEIPEKGTILAFQEAYKQCIPPFEMDYDIDSFCLLQKSRRQEKQEAKEKAEEIAGDDEMRRTELYKKYLQDIELFPEPKEDRQTNQFFLDLYKLLFSKEAVQSGRISFDHSPVFSKKYFGVDNSDPILYEDLMFNISKLYREGAIKTMEHKIHPIKI